MLLTNPPQSSLIEFSVAEGGDLVVGPNGDFQLSYGPQALAEHIMVRLHTYFNDAASMPNVGATIEDFAGKPNTREVGEALEKVALEALTRDNFLDPSAVTITATPLGLNAMTLWVDPDPDGTGLFQGVISFNIDLSTGKIFN